MRKIKLILIKATFSEILLYPVYSNKAMGLRFKKDPDRELYKIRFFIFEIIYVK